MSWILLLSLALVVPLLGVVASLLLGRILPRRGGLLVAALPLFLSAVALLVLVQLAPPAEELAEVIAPQSPPVAALSFAPTAPWVQASRTLNLPTEPPPTTTVAPTAPATLLPSPTPHPFSQVTVVVRNGTGESGLATRVTRQLTEQGFRVLSPEDDPLQGSRPQTLILDRGDHPTVRQALAEFAHVEAPYIRTYASESSEADIVVILGDNYHALASATPAPTPTLVGGPTATPNPYAGVTIVVRNGTAGRPGLATRTADRLRASGFTVLDTEDDDRAGARPHTLILDRGDHPAVRQALVSLLKVADEYVMINSDEQSQGDIVIILGDDFQE